MIRLRSGVSLWCWVAICGLCVAGHPIRAAEPEAPDVEAQSAAEFILQLLREPGASVLAGTEFAPLEEATAAEAAVAGRNSAENEASDSELLLRRMLTGKIRHWAAESRRRQRSAHLPRFGDAQAVEARGDVAPLAFEEPPVENAETAAPLEPAQVLRHAARRLDRLAAELEEAALYAEADELRGYAQELRERGRTLIGGPSATR